MEETVVEAKALPFRRVPPDALGVEWSEVEPGISAAIRRCGMSWIADDVLTRLVDERAALYRNEHGLLVLEQCTEPLTGEKYLNVWLAWFPPGKGVEARRAAITWLDAMKAAHNCAWIEFSSPRAGWTGLEPDFKPYMVVWRRA